MISARSLGSLTIESNVCRQPAFVSPHELVMLFTPWHFVHSCATTSLPAPSGRSAAPPFLWPATGAIDQAKIAAAARIPSEIFDMSPPREDRVGRDGTGNWYYTEYPAKRSFIYTLLSISGGDPTCMRRVTGSRRW